jgi:hypothetical protein
MKLQFPTGTKQVSEEAVLSRRLLVGFVVATGLFCAVCDRPLAQICTAADIKSRVVELAYDPARPFNAVTYGDCGNDPTTINSCNNPPKPASPSTIPAATLGTYASDIAAAFSIAPPHLQTALCGLYDIFIVPQGTPLETTNPFFWGMRERLYQYQMHIGLSQRIWADQNFNRTGYPVADFESYVTDTLLGSGYSAYGYYTYYADTDSADPSDNRFKIVGVLAHEMAHIFWWNSAIENKSCQVQTPSGATRYRNFANISWRPKAMGNPHIARGFHRFGEDQGNVGNTGISVAKIADQMAHGNDNEFYNVYKKGYFADLFARVAPDEDFAESYKLWIWSQMQINLSIEIPSGSADFINLITGNFNSSNRLLQLPTKHTWIDSWVTGNCL